MISVPMARANAEAKAWAWAEDGCGYGGCKAKPESVKFTGVKLSGQ